MSNINQIATQLSEVTILTATVDGVRVSTQCLYPSNGCVTVAVRGGDDQFVVTDDGGALSEISSAGLAQRPTDRQVRALVQQQGLKVQNGAIYSPPVTLDAVAMAILLVANAAKEVADWGLDHLRFSVPRNFRSDLTELLQRHFHDNMKDDQPVVGASNKPHKFGHVIYLQNEKRLLVDPVVNDSSSINARVVANLDVKMKRDPLIEQMIIYDDRLQWRASDLKLLQVGAPIVPFSSANREVQRLAA
jgi:hypothetical protein